MKRHLPSFGVVVARRDAVANDPQREPLRVARQRILVEREHILCHRGREPLSAFLSEDHIHEDGAGAAEAYPPRRFLKPQVQPGQPWGMHQSYHLRFLTPGLIGRCGIRKPDAEDTVAGNAPVVAHRQRVARFGREALHRIPIQGSDVRHAFYPP